MPNVTMTIVGSASHADYPLSVLVDLLRLLANELEGYEAEHDTDIELPVEISLVSGEYDGHIKLGVRGVEQYDRVDMGDQVHYTIMGANYTLCGALVLKEHRRHCSWQERPECPVCQKVRGW